VSVREQAAIIVNRLRSRGQVSFRSLVADADTTLVIVARFLALLELFKESAIAFEQAEALGELDIRWTGSDEGDVSIEDEFDEDDETREAGTGPDDGPAPRDRSAAQQHDSTTGGDTPRTGADDE
jgi:segregation and condensation protein A